jgi:hypothetical protein
MTGADFCNTLVYDAHRGEVNGMLFGQVQAELASLLQTEDVATSNETVWDDLVGFGRNVCAFIERVAEEKPLRDMAKANKDGKKGMFKQGSRFLDYMAFATSTAASSCVSLPWLNASRESSTQNLGTMPLFSSIRPCHVR